MDAKSWSRKWTAVGCRLVKWFSSDGIQRKALMHSSAGSYFGDVTVKRFTNTSR